MPVVEEEISLEERAKIIASVWLSFRDYMFYVHEWELRDHQELWCDALQALTEGKLRNFHISNNSRDEKGFLQYEVKDSPTTGCLACVGFRGCSPEHRTNKLAILAPPGSGKSMIVEQWAEWMIGKATVEGQVPLGGYVSAAVDTAAARVRLAGKVIRFNEKYKEVFPTAIPDLTKWGQEEFYLERPPKEEFPFPTLRAAGFDSTILSWRWPTFEIIDDPHQGTDPSSGEKEKAHRTWNSEIKTRGVLGTTPVVMICTRQDDDDLAGRVIKTEGDWAVIHQPALLEDETSFWEPEVVNGMPMGLKTTFLLRERKVNPRGFLTQYQALPPSVEGNILRWIPEWRYPRPDEVKAVYQAWDTAQTEKSKRRGSYSVGIEAAWLKDGKLFLNRVYRERRDPVALFDDMTRFWQEGRERWGTPPLVLVENQASGPALVAFQKAYGAIGPYIKTVNIPGKPGQYHPGSGDMVQRSAVLAQLFEAGSILIPAEFTTWKEAYRAELLSFGPDAQYKDQVAATLILAEYVFPPTADYSGLRGFSFSLPGWTVN